MSTIGALIMAAGSSERFGSDKRLYDNGDGPLLQQTLKRVLQLDLPTTLVLRAGDKERLHVLLGPVEKDPALSCFFVTNPERGIGHNIAAFFHQAPAWDGAMIFLADMPRIKPATSRQLMEKFDPEKIIAPYYQGRRGHPVLFPRRLFTQLAQLNGDTGANALLQRLRHSVEQVPVDDTGVILDIDTPAG